jgi:hypothetical protein
MGCDIHVYVEYSHDGKYWNSLTENAGSRDYAMFGILAGVRYRELKLFDPKGLPNGELSWQAATANILNIAPEKHPEFADTDGWTDRASAESWVAEGLSTPMYIDGVLHRVTNPDWHSHSWLTSDELSQCIEKYRAIPESKKAPSEWVGILAAMKAIEENGDQTRVVFWFDN